MSYDIYIYYDIIFQSDFFLFYKKITLKNDVIVDFDPLYLRNHTFLDHSSQQNFDQH